jgi:23S rRNA (cytidine2498-2'-O)-methyltransferase
MAARAQPLGATCYLAPEGFVDELIHELGDVRARYDRLVLAPGPPREVAWAQNTWLETCELAVESIGDAARALRAIQRNWWLHSTRCHRRARLIHDKLPPVRPRPVKPYAPVPTAPLGAWTLIDEGTVLLSPRCSSPFPDGEVRFEEDSEGPPSRAYRKLWEALTVFGIHPEPGERCLDLGSSPGGWTWALAALGARVVSVDKAPLAPGVAALDRVEFRRQSAFALDPRELGPIDWLFSDIICYPQRLLQLVRRWLEAGTCERFVVTLKFQGKTDFEVMRAFAAIPGSRLVHLHHNRHELTWIKI